MFKPVSAVGIEVLMSRHKIKSLSWKSPWTELEISLSRGDVGGCFIDCFNRGFG